MLKKSLPIMLLVLLVTLGTNAEAGLGKIAWKAFQTIAMDVAVSTVQDAFADDESTQREVTLKRKISDLENQLHLYSQNGDNPPGFSDMEQTIINLKSITDRVASLDGQNRVNALGSNMDTIEAVKQSILKHENYSDLSVRPSFDCAKARTQTERAICGNSELSHVDARLSRIYSRLRQSLSKSNFKQLRNKQRAWLKQRDYCSDDLNCLSQSYNQRIVDLEAKLSSKPSFNCAKASTKTEKAICNNSELSHADNEVSKLYSQLRKSLSKSAIKELRNEQRAWLKNRNTCYDDVNCLLESYEDRNNEMVRNWW